MNRMAIFYFLLFAVANGARIVLGGDSKVDSSASDTIQNGSSPYVEHISSTAIKIPYSKMKNLSTTKPITGEILKDLIEAAKHSHTLAQDLRHSKVLSDATKIAIKNYTSNGNSEEDFDEGDYNYNYDYDDDYNYDENVGIEVTQKDKTMKSTTATKKSANQQYIRKDNTIDAMESIKKKDIVAHDEYAKLFKVFSNSMSNNTDNGTGEFDYEDDSDEDVDSSDGDDAANIVFNKNVHCPKDCICARNINSYLVATCSRLDPGKQKFGSDITDLVVENAGPKFPILLGPEFFVKLGLKHISSIKINNCTIEYLHQLAFHGLDELYAVNLTNVGLAIINPDTFASNKKLRMLTISGNDLSIMSSVHYLLKSSSIEELDLSHNNLMELNANAFSKLSNIVYINLSQNNLQKLPDKVFHNLNTIEELDLSYNSLKTLPKFIFDGTALSILRLCYNEITNDLSFGTSELQQLDLSFNSIEIVHHGMFDKMTALTNLILKGNGIKKIQTDSFLTLRNLRNIDLSVNEIDQVSSLLFYKNSELDVIRLNDNPKLSQLPTDGFQSFNGYFAVYFFDISNCAIGALGQYTFATMPLLTTLKLSWNNINNLESGTFATLKKLSDLDLSNNLIVKLDEHIFANNHDLSKLSLAGNPIRKLSLRVFSPINRLLELDLSECELHSLPIESQIEVGHKYKIYETLRSLNASSNQIKKVSPADIAQFRNLQTLDISHNPLKCNEDFQFFINYVSSKTRLVSKKIPSLVNLKLGRDTIDKAYHITSWKELSHEVCNHQELSTTQKNIKQDDDDESQDTTPLIDSIENKENLQKKKEQTKLKKMNSVFEVSQKNDESVPDEKKNKFVKKLHYDEYNDDRSYDEQDEESEEENDEYRDDIETHGSKLLLSTTTSSIHWTELDSKNDIDARTLQDKFLLHVWEPETLRNESDEIIIERDGIYYNDYRFLALVIVIITCGLLFLIALAKIITLIIRRRGDRYRLALLASSKNSFVYQKLSEEIKSTQNKDLKWSKNHQYTPIHQVYV